MQPIGQVAAQSYHQNLVPQLSEAVQHIDSRLQTLTIGIEHAVIQHQGKLDSRPCSPFGHRQTQAQAGMTTIGGPELLESETATVAVQEGRLTFRVWRHPPPLAPAEMIQRTSSVIPQRVRRRGRTKSAKFGLQAGRLSQELVPVLGITNLAVELAQVLLTTRDLMGSGEIIAIVAGVRRNRATLALILQRTGAGSVGTAAARSGCRQLVSARSDRSLYPIAGLPRTDPTNSGSGGRADQAMPCAYQIRVQPDRWQAAADGQPDVRWRRPMAVGCCGVGAARPGCPRRHARLSTMPIRRRAGRDRLAPSAVRLRPCRAAARIGTKRSRCPAPVQGTSATSSSVAGAVAGSGVDRAVGSQGCSRIVVRAAGHGCRFHLIPVAIGRAGHRFPQALAPAEHARSRAKAPGSAAPVQRGASASAICLSIAARS